MPEAFYDTNLFPYASMQVLPPRDKPKRAVARQLIANAGFGTSTQVLAEYYANAVRKGAVPLTHDQAMEWVDLMTDRPCIAVDAGIVLTGARLAARYRISYWDGAIVAAAHQLGVTTIFTEDLNDGQRYGGVMVVNPFRPMPAH